MARVRKLKELGEIVTGNTPSMSDSRNYESNDICFIKPSDIHEEAITALESSEFFIAEYARKKARIVPKGSILVTCIGSIGKIGITEKECSFNQQINAILPNEELVDTSFLAHYLSYKKKELQDLANSAVVPIINKSQFSELEIKLPRLEHQKKTAHLLDFLDNIIYLRKEQLAKLDQLVKARFVEMFGKIKYSIVRTSDVCDFITKGTTPLPQEIVSDANNNIPFFKVYNLSFTGECLFEENPQFVSRETHEKKLSRSKVFPKDVLMNIVGPPLGKFALVPDNFVECNINQAIAIFRPLEKLNPVYLLHALMQPRVLRPFLLQAEGVRQLNLSLEQCRNLEIPLPPLPLQEEFATFVQKVDKSKAAVKQSLEKLETLKKSLMQEYFG